MTGNEQKTYRLQGRLTVDEVPDVYRRHEVWKDSGVPAVIDLAALEAADSSAVALLLEWKNWARRSGREVRFDNPPEALRTIAGLSQVDDILGWKDQ